MIKDNLFLNKYWETQDKIEEILFLYKNDAKDVLEKEIKKLFLESIKSNWIEMTKKIFRKMHNEGDKYIDISMISEYWKKRGYHWNPYTKFIN